MSPLTNAVAPVIIVIISLAMYKVIPHGIIITGMIFAIITAFLMSLEGGSEEEVKKGSA